MNREERIDEELQAAFRARKVRAASPCPDEEKLIAFYREGPSEEENESVRDHLSECAACVGLARDARSFLDAMGEPGASGGAAPRSASRARWLTVAAAIAIGAAAGLWLARDRGPLPSPAAPSAAPSSVAREPANPWRNLPIGPALYQPPPAEDDLLWRSGEEAPAASRGARDFQRAMAPYVRGDYLAAERGLALFLASHASHAEASFYRGVSLLLLGREGEARAALETAVRLASGAARDEARWYLAHALLKSGESAGALRQLDALARSEGRRRVEAERLGREVRGYPEREPSRR